MGVSLRDLNGHKDAVSVDMETRNIKDGSLQALATVLALTVKTVSDESTFKIAETIKTCCQ